MPLKFKEYGSEFSFTLHIFDQKVIISAIWFNSYFSSNIDFINGFFGKKGEEKSSKELQIRTEK